MIITKDTLTQILTDAEAQQAQAREMLAVAHGAIQVTKHLLAELDKPEKVEPADGGD